VSQHTNPKRKRGRTGHRRALTLLGSIAILLLVVFAGATRSKADPAESHHWSFRALKRPPVPHGANQAWPANPIDHFVLARLNDRDLRLQPQADRQTLIRRVTIDLTGLPPTLAEIDAFLADESPLAYEILVDRLLASPALGERFAQFWLDLARWAETDGFEHDHERKDAWQYRDWVIDALNRDLPYDEFLSLQLAGDELRPGDAWARTATGFCLSGPDMPDINLQEERRHAVLNELTGTVGAVFLGLQFGCAECHDHKFDPITQADFYRLRAIFEPAVDFKSHTFNEQQPKVGASYVYLRGDFRRAGPEVKPAFPTAVNPWKDEVQTSPKDSPSTRRRTQLAQWLTKPDHPLTSRVLVNRLWQQHFGRGLAATASDFGSMGDEPEDKALLDWLACELVDSGWSMKHIHRLIVTSATYRQASRPSSPDDANWKAAMQGNPKNRFWSRFPRRRLDGETLRDVMLAASDSLNRQQAGESVRPPLPEEVVQTLLSPSHWKVSASRTDHDRRSVYIFARRNLRYPLFEAFDRPAATLSCDRRSPSTTAPQSLMLLNSEFSLEAARRLAAFVKQRAGDDPRSQITMLFRQTLARSPTEAEFTQIEVFLREADENGFVDLCLAIFNSNEFVYLE
jgi:hypothetical protein